MFQWLRNIFLAPRRAIESLRRRRAPGYAIQRRADAYAHHELASDLRRRLAAVPGNTSERKCRILFYLAATTPAEGCFVEIGAYKGKSTAWLAEAARRRGRRLVSIDPHLKDSFDAFQQTVQQFHIDRVATLHRALSHEIGNDWREPIAFLWIDGGHDYETVRQDIDDFTPHVRPGGFVVFDDYNPDRFPGIIRAVQETLAGNAAFEDLGILKTFRLFQRKPA